MRQEVFKRPRTALMAFAAALALVGANAMAYEEPTYQVVQTFPEFELRRYEPYLVAQTQVTGDFDEAGNKAFRILAGYIFGDNRRREKMEMTAPVNQSPAAGEGEKIEMAAPVTQESAARAGESGNYVLSFVMPSRYTWETLP